MWQTVRELKEKAVRALVDEKQLTDVDKEINAFLSTNRYAILDILDDAFEAHERGVI